MFVLQSVVKTNALIKVSVMAMKEVRCELVYHCKGKLLLHVVFSLGFHKESNLKLFTMTQRHNLGSKINNARNLWSSKSCTPSVDHYINHISIVSHGIWPYINEHY